MLTCKISINAYSDFFSINVCMEQSHISDFKSEIDGFCRMDVSAICQFIIS